jgi:hypothetical protein
MENISNSKTTWTGSRVHALSRLKKNLPPIDTMAVLRIGRGFTF